MTSIEQATLAADSNSLSNTQSFEPQVCLPISDSSSSLLLSHMIGNEVLGMLAEHFVVLVQSNACQSTLMYSSKKTTSSVTPPAGIFRQVAVGKRRVDSVVTALM